MDSRLNQFLSVVLALVVHVLVLGSFVFAFDWERNHPAPRPLAVTATLVLEDNVPPPVVKPPEPEPVVEEPEPEPEPELPRPDPAEQARAKAEEQARLDELRREQQRKADEERARLQRIEDDKRKAEEEARRKAEAEAELERKRVEAERKRIEEQERQRAENERLRREAEARQLQEQIDAENRRLEARNSEDMLAYMFAIRQKVQRAWVAPASAPKDLECEVTVRQNQVGEVQSVTVVRCNGDAIVVRSIEAAVRRASPLPKPVNPLIFDTNLRFIFKPEQ